MGKVNQSTYTRSRDWAKHLRPTGKRTAAKAERRAALRLIRSSR